VIKRFNPIFPQHIYVPNTFFNCKSLIRIARELFYKYFKYLNVINKYSTFFHDFRVDEDKYKYNYYLLLIDI